MSEMPEAPTISLSLVIATGCATIVLASALAYVLLETRKKKKKTEEEVAPKPEVIIDKEQYPGGQISVYYATQTGTAESFARQLEREGPEHGFFVHVVDLEDINVEDVVDDSRKDEDSGTARAIFLTATYGEGEAPDNSTLFVEALKERAATEIFFEEKKTPDLDAPESSLVGLDYCVFGLGNRQYDHFNAMGKFFDHAIERVGGNRILPLGLGDDDDDLEGDFESWKDKKLWPLMKQKFLPDPSVLKERRMNGAIKHELPDCQYAVEYLDTKQAKREKIPIDQVHGSSRHYFTSFDCPVTMKKELRSSKDSGSTVHVEIDISKAKGLEYHTADNLGVLPVNNTAVVESVAQSLGYDLDAVFKVKAAPSHEWHGAPFPMPITVRECLTRYCDLTGPPRRSDLRMLASYAKDPVDQKALLRMSSKEGRAEYKEKILEGYVGLVDLFERCPSIEMPLEHFLNLCPLLQTRFFTISSSSSVYPRHVHLTVAVTEAERKDGTLFKGLCSNYLAVQNPGSQTIRVFNRPSTFRLPKDSTRPILMIGPGTGIAPMRALLQERAYQRKKLKKVVGENILYFGCKKRSHDYLYEDELRRFRDDGDLHKLYVAFSREQSEKVYVQHLLLKNASETWKLIDEESAYIYVCGGVKMGHDVSEALKKIVESEGRQSTEDAKDYLSKLTSEGRYVQELWT